MHCVVEHVTMANPLQLDSLRRVNGKSFILEIVLSLLLKIGKSIKVLRKLCFLVIYLVLREGREEKGEMMERP